MKVIVAVSALAIGLLAGCTTDRHYGASDEYYSTPSWGTSSHPASGGTADAPVINNEPSADFRTETETMTPSAGQAEHLEDEMPPNYTDESGNTEPPVDSPDFGPQRR